MAKPKPQPITILVDTREQTPWSFTLPTVVATVPTGADYSVVGFEALIGIERKSIDDLIGSLTTGRDRFMRSLEALRTRPYRALVIEGSLADLARGEYVSLAHPNSVLGSLASIWADGVPCFFAGDAKHAAAFAERLLLKFHKRALAARQSADPLDRFPTFIAEVRKRLEAGRAAYGDKSFSRPPAELLRELEQECLDMAGWGFVLFERMRNMRERARMEAHDEHAEVQLIGSSADR